MYEISIEQIINLLDDLHSFGLLNARVVELVGINLGVDAKEICLENGITYFIE